jgi:peptidoglycan/LPS O-acetylase OafA/YrhL
LSLARTSSDAGVQDTGTSHSKFAVLDGMRGIAALFVVVGHTGDLWGITFPRSYLAVDLFFILSGFVIAHAYDRKLATGNLTPIDFMKVRLIRLYPVYFLSIVVCVAVLLLEGRDNSLSKVAPPHEFVTVTALSLLFLPSVLTGNLSVFPLNFPYWSLAWELFFNAVYAAVHRWLTRRALVLLVVLAAAFLAYCSFKNGGLGTGFLWGVKSVVTGCARCLFGIFMGILVHRHVRTGRFSTSLWSRSVPIAVVCLVLASPATPGLDWIVELLVVTLLFPCCVALGGQPSQGRFDGVLLLLGSASYPIYVLHKPLGDLTHLVFNGRVDLASMAPWAGAVFVVVLVALTVWLERVYDLPVRRMLTKRMRRNAARG